MAGDSTPAASNVTAPRQLQKRKRDTTSSRQSSNKSARTSTPNAYARRTPPREPAPLSENEDEDRPKQLKRPGAGARIGVERREAAEAARKQREEAEQQKILAERQALGSADLVAEHYNAVPERGREWRKTDSQIKGLRSLNNWIKSTLIQKFSRPEVIPQHGVTVLDMACGKGGDLGKWEKAPIVPALYVGCDIAEVSIEQAKQRYAESQRKGGRYRRGPSMEAQFYVQDTFGRSLGDIPVVRQVGFNPNAGPGPGIIQGGMFTGGFDVVSMMFALHYSFENEGLARGMLKNVAGALKKGGRFIGVMPNSDVISGTVKKLLHAEAPGQTPASGKSISPRENGGEVNGKADEEDDWDPEKPSEPNGGDAAAVEEDEWDPEKPSEPQPPTTNNEAPQTTNAADEEDDWDPEKPSEPSPTATSTTSAPISQANGTSAQPSVSTTPAADPSAPPLEWGNTLYTVRFPRHQPLTRLPLPRDGIFRPPYGWKYNYLLSEAVDAPEFVVPWESLRALAEEYGLELLYRRGFGDVLKEELLDEVRDGGGVGEVGVQGRKELVMLAERMGVMSRDRSEGRGGLLVTEEEMEAAGFYHAFCFYKT